MSLSDGHEEYTVTIFGTPDATCIPPLHAPSLSTQHAWQPVHTSSHITHLMVFFHCWYSAALLHGSNAPTHFDC